MKDTLYCKSNSCDVSTRVSYRKSSTSALVLEIEENRQISSSCSLETLRIFPKKQKRKNETNFVERCVENTTKIKWEEGERVGKIR